MKKIIILTIIIDVYWTHQYIICKGERQHIDVHKFITHDKDNDIQCRAQSRRKKKRKIRRKWYKCAGFTSQGCFAFAFRCRRCISALTLENLCLGFECVGQRERGHQKSSLLTSPSLSVIKDSPKETCDSIKSFSYHYCPLPLICFNVGAWAVARTTDLMQQPQNIWRHVLHRCNV